MNSEIIKLALEELNKVIEYEIEPLKKIKKKIIIENEKVKDPLLLELATEITPNKKNQLINYEYKKKMKNIKIEGFSKEIIELYEDDKNYTDFNSISFLRFFLNLVCEEVDLKKFKKANIESKMREYAKNFIINLAEKYNGNNTESFYRNMNDIAELNYENKQVNGKILLLKNEDEKDINYMLKLSQKIIITDIIMIRKLLEMTGEKKYLISNGYEILGIGNLKENITIENRKMLVIKFLGKRYYQLSYVYKKNNQYTEQYIVEIKNGCPKLNKEDYNENILSDIYMDIFGKEISEELKIIVEGANKQAKGTMLVITDKAKEQVLELSNYGMVIEKKQINEDEISNITSIDGAVILDIDGYCHGVGVILDGIAKGAKGNPERGARYNSAVKYIAKCENENIKVLVIVFSEDGIVDILPKRKNSMKEFNKYLLESKIFMETFEWEKAIKACTEIIKLDKSNIDAYFNRGVAETKLNLYEEALNDYNKVIALDKNSPVAHANKGYINSILTKYEEAIEDYDKAIKLNKYDEFSYHGRGIAKFELFRNKEAIEDYNKAIKLNEKVLNIYINKGRANTRLENYKEAIEDYNKAIELNNNSEEIYFNRGVVKSKMSQFNEAIEDYNKAIKLNNNYKEAYLNRGLIKITQEKIEEALKDFRRAIKIDNKYDEKIFYYLNKNKMNYIYEQI